MCGSIIGIEEAGAFFYHDQRGDIVDRVMSIAYGTEPEVTTVWCRLRGWTCNMKRG